MRDERDERDEMNPAVQLEFNLLFGSSTLTQQSYLAIDFIQGEFLGIKSEGIVPKIDQTLGTHKSVL